MKKKVSLKDIAKKAGVSTALVSYTLNNKEKEGRVGKEMAKKIRAIAEELQYRPNQIAKSLKSGTTQTLGVIVADISNPFFANIARVMEDEAKTRGYNVIFGSSDENVDKSWDLIKVLQDRQVDGFIIAPSEGTEKQIAFLKDNNFHVVLIDRVLPNISANCVLTDNYSAVYDAVGHLLDNGHRKIGMIASDIQLNHMLERTQAYRDALTKAKIPFNEKWLQTIKYKDIKREVDYAVEQVLLPKDPVTAVLFATNTLGLNGLRKINQMGLKVPDELSIVCFDESEAFDLFYCPITYVRQPLQEIARTSVNMLIDQIDNDDMEVKKTIIKSDLIIRESSGVNKRVQEKTMKIRSDD